MLNKYFYSLKQKEKELLSHFQKPLGQVLMFHNIVPENNIIFGEENFIISTKSFKELINYLSEKHVFKKTADIINSEDKHQDDIYITFDDGFESVYSYALPILSERNIPFTVFLTWNYMNKKDYLTADMVKKLSDNRNCTIGSHSLSHPIFRNLNHKKAELEIVESKEKLELFLGKKVDQFAFPYGSIYACSNKNVQKVKDSGYEMSFSTINSCLAQKDVDKPFFIPRKNINDYSSKLIK